MAVVECWRHLEVEECCCEGLVEQEVEGCFQLLELVVPLVVVERMMCSYSRHLAPRAHILTSVFVQLPKPLLD